MEEKEIFDGRKHRVAVIGCGALGSEIARLLVQNGVDFLRLIDRDFLEMHDAETHLLFGKHTIMEGLPKTIALREFFEVENPAAQIEAIIDDVNRLNIVSLIQDFDLIIDAVNNSFTHQLINEACVKLKKPLLVSWLDGSRGAAMTVIPGRTSCLNCVLDSENSLPDIPLDKKKKPTHETIAAIAKLQVNQATEILENPQRKFDQQLFLFDSKKSSHEIIDITKSRIQPNCSVCNNRRFPRLDGRIGSVYIHAIGENTLQIIPFQPRKIDLPTLAFNLSEQGDVLVNDFLLIFKKSPYELVIFPDGRTFVRGTTDSGIAMEMVRRILVSGLVV